MGRGREESASLCVCRRLDPVQYRCDGQVVADSRANRVAPTVAGIVDAHQDVAAVKDRAARVACEITSLS